MKDIVINYEFIQINRIYDIKSYFNNSNLSLFFQKTPCKDYIEFFNKLYAFNRKKSANKKEVYVDAVELIVLLPALNTAQLKEYIQKFSKNFRNLPFICLIDKKDRGFYLHFVISERYYDRNRKNVVIKYTSDVYLYTNDNGRKVFCSKDTDGAILIHKKGEVKATINDKFSNKVRLFCGTIAIIKDLCKNLKKKSKYLVNSLTKNNRNLLKFNRIQRSKAGTNVYTACNIKEINKFLILFDDRVANVREDNIILYDSVLKIREKVRNYVNSKHFYSKRTDFYHEFKQFSSNIYIELEQIIGGI